VSIEYFDFVQDRLIVCSAYLVNISRIKADQVALIVALEHFKTA
jgi:hypothetical protein